MCKNYLKIYDLERYICEDVHKKFHKNGRLDAFDFFCILIWKSNRNKSDHAKRLLDLSEQKDLESAVRVITEEINDEFHDGEKIRTTQGLGTALRKYIKSLKI